ncbi:hypothetical protein FGG08_005048 [Glutinoglossum americanum]|uniref:Aminoglycoside phosphotransferase domain-containing protein n=1 Tax=Glutinoglossum americanum TaxID=1670608 RepID=A0A9P8HV92_9PEZI|nr:hypothetical protein FGG08_005048 [Glutinoglossum americanum]
MDQIRRREVESACNDFIASIDQTAVCDLASSFYDRKPCRMLKEPQRGSYNVCFPVIFASDQESNEGEKWMQFDRIGSLTLDRDDSSWSFGESQPLSIDINDQEVDGLDVGCIIRPDQTYDLAIDYTYTLMQLVFNQFLRGRHSVYNEKNARSELYGLHKFRTLLMEYILPEYNHEPFVLMHSNFRSSNIIINENLNIVSVIDWE